VEHTSLYNTQDPKNEKKIYSGSRSSFYCYEINIWMGLQAFFGGLFFGLIREKSKSIISSGIAHGVPNAFGQVLAMALK